MAQDITYYYCWFADIMNGVHDMSSDTIKIALSNTAPNVSTHTTLADVSEITAGNGYTSGGQALDNITSTQTSGVYSFTADNETVAASAGSIAQFQYVILYNSTASDKLIAYWDNGTAVDLTDGESFECQWTGGTLFTYQES